MDLTLTDERRAIRDAARDFLTDAASPDRVRAAVEGGTGFDADLWRGLAIEMGFAGLIVPEAHGGAGLGAIDMALVLEETGRCLAPVPFFETAVVAVTAVLAGGDAAQQAHYLPRLAAGARVSVAGTADRPTFRAGRLTGSAGFATFAHVAELILVATDDDRIVVLEADTPGLTVAPLPGLDRTRRFARLTFDCAVADGAVLARPGAMRQAMTIGAGLLAAEQTGAAQYSLDATVDYVKQRVQFGRTIGSFQAVKHMLADMMLLVEASRSAALAAAAAIDMSDGAVDAERDAACHAARAYASDAFRQVAADAIQLHGGIGFTWEHHAHLYFKRARASATWLGTADAHREALARIILEDAA
ncbi:acyl-CoA/acyl-ACP dehydrogenase [Sphingomonas sp. RP10(2022)]|uniref:Acyl-CoA/acyl-ACP dehydrogenase n=1 Tax=Sphingomonas liriopis TaxID=2949094 RepID=A0A9X2HSH8_9SPHN|nr:acyl-CoA dehydrogenase family protein [Sphingomonas liriopis]MCP3733506.1 acyl-CoA/acyl-ACP dehydrogenase [Sphingomonas liriopis]